MAGCCSIRICVCFHRTRPKPQTQHAHNATERTQSSPAATGPETAAGNRSRAAQYSPDGCIDTVDSIEDAGLALHTQSDSHNQQQQQQQDEAVQQTVHGGLRQLNLFSSEVAPGVDAAQAALGIHENPILPGESAHFNECTSKIQGKKGSKSSKRKHAISSVAVLEDGEIEPNLLTSHQGKRAKS